jgi:hypothetical protein
LGLPTGWEESSFYRIAGASRLSDERLVVLNGGTMEIRYFNPSGQFLLQSGGRGMGPGEFQRFSNLQVLPSDSVLVYDARQSRVSVYDAVGTLAYVTRLNGPPDLSPGDLVGRFPDRSFAMRYVATRFSTAKETVYRDMDLILRQSPGGELLDTIAVYPGAELAAINRGGGQTQIMPPPFARRRLYVMTPEGLVSGSNDGFEFITQDVQGDLRKIDRLLCEPEPVSAEDREAIPPDMYPNITFPSTKPTFDRILGDPLGGYWIERYRLPADGRESQWEVIDKEGAWVTTVMVPGDLQVTQIGRDFMLGTARDSMGIEYVRLHRLLRRSR